MGGGGSSSGGAGDGGGRAASNGGMGAVGGKAPGSDGGGRAANNGGMSGRSGAVGDGGGRAANNGGMSAVGGKAPGSDGGGRAANNGGMSSVSNSASPGRSTPSQSIADARSARESFGMTSQNTRTPNVAKESNDSVTEGQVTSLDQPLVSLVSENTDADSRTQEGLARMQAVSLVQPQTRDIAHAVQNAVAKSEVGKATDDGLARSLAESVIGFPVSMIADVAENAVATNNVNDSATSLTESMSLPEGFFGEVSIGDANSAAIGISTNNVLGDSKAVSKATLGLASPPSVDGPTAGGGGRVGLIADEIANSKAGTSAYSNSQSSSFSVGDIGKYASYARRVFSII